MQVGQQGTFACPAATGAVPNSGLTVPSIPAYSSQYASDPLLGFNTLTQPLVRAFGDGNGVNQNQPCTNVTTPLGDAAGLELWTYFPSVTFQSGEDCDANTPGVQDCMPAVTIVPEPLHAYDDGPYVVAALNTTYNSNTLPDHGNADGPGDERFLYWNDHYDVAPAALTCQIATNFAGTTWGTAGSIYNSAGAAVGTISLVGAVAGAPECDYTFLLNTGRRTAAIRPATS